MIKEWQRTWCFTLGLGLLSTHELDAMTHHEWRVLPILNHLDEVTAMPVFVILHVPLFALIIGLVSAQNRKLREYSRLAVASFLMIHAGLHSLYANHPHYEFANPLSDSLIYGGAVMGFLWILISAIHFRHEREKNVTALLTKYRGDEPEQ